MIVKYGALKIAKLLKIYIMISLDRLLTLKSTPIYMIHAELGRHPIQINIKSRMIGFWLSIFHGKESKLSKLLHSIMRKEHEKGSYNFKLIRCINDILVSVGWPDLFKTNQSITQILCKWIFHEHC